MNQIAKLVQKLAFYQVELGEQVTAIREFLRFYSTIDTHGTDMLFMLDGELGGNVEELEKLEHSLRDALQVVRFTNGFPMSLKHVPLILSRKLPGRP